MAMEGVVESGEAAGDGVEGEAALAEFVRQAVRSKRENPRAYASLKQGIHDAVNGGDNETIAKWLYSLCQCVSCLEPRSTNDLVQIVLRVDWFSASDEALDLLSDFVLALASAHSVYAETCMVQIVRNFVGRAPAAVAALPDDEAAAAIEEADRELHARVAPRACTLLHELLGVVPSQAERLVKVLEGHVPHVRCEPRVHRNFVQSLLQFCLLDAVVLSPLVLPVVVQHIVQVDIDAGDLGGGEDDEDEDDDDDDDDGDESVDSHGDGDDDAQSVGSVLSETQFDLEDDADGDSPLGADSTRQVDATPMGEEVEEEDDEETPGKALDDLMGLCYKFIRNVVDADPVSGADRLFDVLYRAFEHSILRTYQTRHVQCVLCPLPPPARPLLAPLLGPRYLLFFLCSLSPQLPQHFVVQLLETAARPHAPVLHRQTAMAYVGSYIARGRYVPTAVIRGVLTSLADSARDYARDHVRPTHDPQCLMFYARCQALFYVVCFRLDELMAMDDGSVFVGSLQLDSIVGCTLCPLQVCEQGVVRQFERVTLAHEVLYCANYRRRRRSVLSARVEGFHRVVHDGDVPAHQHENYFPFDPYLLPLSIAYIRELYNVWNPSAGGREGGDDDSSDDEEAEGGGYGDDDDDEDDFLPGNSSSLESAASSHRSLPPAIPALNGGSSAVRRAPSAGSLPLDVPVPMTTSTGVPLAMAAMSRRRKRLKGGGVVGAPVAGFFGSPISPFQASPSPGSLCHVKKR